MMLSRSALRSTTRLATASRAFSNTSVLGEQYDVVVVGTLQKERFEVAAVVLQAQAPSDSCVLVLGRCWLFWNIFDQRRRQPPIATTYARAHSGVRLRCCMLAARDSCELCVRCAVRHACSPPPPPPPTGLSHSTTS
jgi:hypothetical protein